MVQATFSNHIVRGNHPELMLKNSTSVTRCVEFFHMSSGWFDCTEPSLTTSLQGKQGVQGAYALVRGGSSASNLFKPHHHRDNKKCTGNRLNFACGANSSITEITIHARASFFDFSQSSSVQFGKTLCYGIV